MPRFKLVVEYAGTRYGGWPIQTGVRTVQGELERAVGVASGEWSFQLQGAACTGAGVHALQQVAHLQLDRDLGPDTLRDGLNEALPSDINVLVVGRAPERFHARRDAVGWSYLYQISRRRAAFATALAWCIREPLDVAAMRDAAAALPRSLADLDRADPSATDVPLARITIAEHDSLVLVRVEGSRRPSAMVQRIVFMLVDAGREALTAPAVAPLSVPFPRSPRRIAPAWGLFLEHVQYACDRCSRPLRPVLNIPDVPGSPDPRTSSASVASLGT